MRGHADSVTGLSLSSEGSYLLSNAMDNTVRVWDVRPFAPKERCVKIFQGNVHNFEKNLLRCSWSPDGSKIAAGSADRFVYVWDTTSRRILYKLPGHAGSINEVAFHPDEPIILSASSDKRLYMGEIQWRYGMEDSRRLLDPETSNSISGTKWCPSQHPPFKWRLLVARNEEEVAMFQTTSVPVHQDD